MAFRRVSPELVASIPDALARHGGGVNPAAVELGISRSTVIKWARRFREARLTTEAQRLDLARAALAGFYQFDESAPWTESLPVAPVDETPEPPPEIEPEPPATAFKRTEDDHEARVEFLADRRIRTLDEALEYAEVDRAVWRVDRWECSSWEVALRVRRGQDADKRWLADQPVQKQLWRVKLHLVRIWPRAWQDAAEALFARLAESAPSWPTLAPATPPHEPHLAVFDLFDAHFGKLCWAPESGEDYDIKTAERVYQNAVEDLRGRVAGYPVDRVVLPVGNDFFNFDNLQGQTTGGTPQDNDSRYAKVIEAGERAVIRAVETLAAVAPVDVLWVPGNHDTLSSYHLTRVLAAWFRRSDRVTVDTGPAKRKYLRYGTTLLGFTHGDKERPASLPTLMAQERKQDWALTTCREWHTGHFHRGKKLETVTTDTYQGVAVRTLRALTATDAWHHDSGYIGTQRAAEVYLYAVRDGYTGHFAANVRP